MPIEHEAKILEIDPETVQKLILDKGGQNLGEKFMRRYVYDVTPGDESTWIRLRDNDGETTLTVKQITHDGIDGTYETEVTVDDFATTNDLLTTLGFMSKSYQETKRTRFELDDAHIDIDQWPQIPPYLEIEAHSKEHVIRVAELLGYAESDLTGENTIKIYSRYGIDLNTITELTF